MPGLDVMMGLRRAVQGVGGCDLDVQDAVVVAFAQVPEFQLGPFGSDSPDAHLGRLHPVGDGDDPLWCAQQLNRNVEGVAADGV